MSACLCHLVRRRIERLERRHLFTGFAFGLVRREAWQSKQYLLFNDVSQNRFVSDEERLAATWGVWGTTLYSADLRAAVGSPFILQIKKPPDVPDELKKVIASSEF